MHRFASSEDRLHEEKEDRSKKYGDVDFKMSENLQKRHVPHPVVDDVEGVMRSILLLMPLQKVIQFRNVNRQWRLLLTSTYFLREWGKTHSGWVVMKRTHNSSGGAELLAYDSVAKSWINLSTMIRQIISNLQVHVDGQSRSTSLLFTSGFNINEECSIADSCNATGLLCFFVRKGIKYLALVLNPLTGFHALIPFPQDDVDRDRNFFYSSHLDLVDVFLRTDDDGSHPHRINYRIFVRKSCNLAMYSSRTRSWTCFYNPAPTNHLRFPFEHVDVIFQSALALPFVAVTSYDPSNYKLSVLAYSSKFNSWRTLEFRNNARLYSTPTENRSRLRNCFLLFSNVNNVFRHGDRLFYATVYIRKGNNDECGDVQGFAIYELQESSFAGGGAYADTCTCVGIAVTPDHLLQGLRIPIIPPKQPHIRAEAVYVYANGLLYMTAFLSTYKDHRCKHIMVTPSPVTIVYDMDANSWHHLPPPPPSHDGTDGSFPTTAADLYDLRPVCTMCPLLVASSHD